MGGDQRERWAYRRESEWTNDGFTVNSWVGQNPALSPSLCRRPFVSSSKRPEPPRIVTRINCKLIANNLGNIFQSVWDNPMDHHRPSATPPHSVAATCPYHCPVALVLNNQRVYRIYCFLCSFDSIRRDGLVDTRVVNDVLTLDYKRHSWTAVYIVIVKNEWLAAGAEAATGERLQVANCKRPPPPPPLPSTVRDWFMM